MYAGLIPFMDLASHDFGVQTDTSWDNSRFDFAAGKGALAGDEIIIGCVFTQKCYGYRTIATLQSNMSIARDRKARTISISQKALIQERDFLSSKTDAL